MKLVDILMNDKNNNNLGFGANSTVQSNYSGCPYISSYFEKGRIATKLEWKLLKDDDKRHEASPSRMWQGEHQVVSYKKMNHSWWQIYLNILLFVYPKSKFKAYILQEHNWMISFLHFFSFFFLINYYIFIFHNKIIQNLDKHTSLASPSL